MESNICPNCKSTNTRIYSVKTNNGILGPGFKSWNILVKHVCNECHTIFKPKENA